MFTGLSSVALGDVSVISLALFTLIMISIIRFIMGSFSGEKDGKEKGDGKKGG